MLTLRGSWAKRRLQTGGTEVKIEYFVRHFSLKGGRDNTGRPS